MEGSMNTRVQKWGNSQGLRFSKGVLEQAAIAVGDEVSVSARRGQIVVTPTVRVRGKYQLKDLLSRMPKQSAPREVEWGKPEGREVW
jgi:antitoxin MazE